MKKIIYLLKKASALAFALALCITLIAVAVAESFTVTYPNSITVKESFRINTYDGIDCRARSNSTTAPSARVKLYKSGYTEPYKTKLIPSGSGVPEMYWNWTVDNLVPLYFIKGEAASSGTANFYLTVEQAG